MHHVEECRFALHESTERAYLFQGKNTLPYFDLRTENWSQVVTRSRDGKPWQKLFPGDTLIGYCAHLYRDKIYVFGGDCSSGRSTLGRNRLTVLDLNDFKWDVLSGTLNVVPDITLPGLRQEAASWLVDGKIYVTLGSAHRSGAGLSGAEHGATSDHSYLDMWSYDIERNLWTNEKYIGNPPSRRTEVGYALNATWGKAVVFGGYDSTMPFDPSSNELFTYSYYADTFVWDVVTRRWSYVITRGFPTYRASPEVFTDPETGRTYLFGGCKLRRRARTLRRANPFPLRYKHGVYSIVSYHYGPVLQ